MSPALDAWISTALHALADQGFEPTIVADPSMRTNLGGYRSEILSIEALRAASVVVTSTGSHVGLIEQLTSVIVFDPSSPAGDHSRTKVELSEAIRQLG